MIPSDPQIACEIAAFGPGLGRMQAINRIRQREFILRERRMQPVPCAPADDCEDASVLIASIEAQLSDPTYADRRAAGQAMIDLHFDAHRDAALRELGYL